MTDYLTDAEAEELERRAKHARACGKTSDGYWLAGPVSVEPPAMCKLLAERKALRSRIAELESRHD